MNRTALAGAYPLTLCRKYVRLIKEHCELKHDKTGFVEQHWKTSLRSLVARKLGDKTTSNSKIDSRSVEQDFQLHRLKQAGGRAKFLDFIALGRDSRKKHGMLQK